MRQRRAVQTGPTPNFLTGKDIRYVDDGPEDGFWGGVQNEMRKARQAFAGRKPGSDYYGLKAPPPMTADQKAELRGAQFAGGLNAARKTAGHDNPRIPNLRPDDVRGINGHVMRGDGSPREIDFRQVSLSDLGGSLHKYSRQPGSPLSNAISKAANTGQAVPIQIKEIKAGKTVLKSKAPLGQQLGIGRFGVNIDGKVRVDGGEWSLEGKAIGMPDRQDYPYDPDRSIVASAGTGALGAMQKLLGGKDYWANFIGAQDIKVTGNRRARR